MHGPTDTCTEKDIYRQTDRDTDNLSFTRSLFLSFFYLATTSKEKTTEANIHLWQIILHFLLKVRGLEQGISDVKIKYTCLIPIVIDPH